MFPLGVLKKKQLWQTVLDLTFNSDLLDATTRHTVLQQTGVSLVGGEAVGTASADLRYGGNPADFNFSGDLILEARFKLPVSLSGGKYLMSMPRVDNNYDGQAFVIYLTSENPSRLAFYFNAAVGSLLIPTANYLPVANAYVTIRLEKIDNRIAIFLNGNNTEGQQVGSITNGNIRTMNNGVPNLRAFQLFGDTSLFVNEGTCDFVKLQKRVV